MGGGLTVGFQYCPFFFFFSLGKLLGFVVMGGMPGVCCCLGRVIVWFILGGSSVSLQCGYRFFFGSGPAWSLVVMLVKLSLNNSSRVFNSFIRSLMSKWGVIP